MLGRSQWPRSLRRRSAAARLLGLWVRIPPGTWTFVCCECCVLSGRGLCDELITRSEASSRLWCVVVCDLETAIANHLRLPLNRRCITGCISYMPLIVTVNTVAGCLRKDCNILRDNKKSAGSVGLSTLDWKAYYRNTEQVIYHTEKCLW